MRHYPKEIVWKRTISYFFAIFKGLTNKPIPTMNNYVSEAEYEEMMDAENAQFGETESRSCICFIKHRQRNSIQYAFFTDGESTILGFGLPV